MKFRVTIRPLPSRQLSVALFLAALALTPSCAAASASIQSPGKPWIDLWPTVMALSPGESIVVTAVGLPPSPRYFVHADDRTITLLNLESTYMPSAVDNAARDLTRRSPELVASGFASGPADSGVVSFRTDGVWMSGHKVAELRRIFPTVNRASVLEIRRDSRRSRAGMITGLSLMGVGLTVRETHLGPPSGGPEPDFTGGMIVGNMMTIAGLVTAVVSGGTRHDVLYTGRTFVR